MKPNGLKPEHNSKKPTDRRMVRIFALLRELSPGVNMDNFCLRYEISHRQLERDLAVLVRAGYPVYHPKPGWRRLTEY